MVVQPARPTRIPLLRTKRNMCQDGRESQNRSLHWDKCSYVGRKQSRERKNKQKNKKKWKTRARENHNHENSREPRPPQSQEQTRNPGRPMHARICALMNAPITRGKLSQAPSVRSLAVRPSARSLALSLAPPPPEKFCPSARSSVRSLTRSLAPQGASEPTDRGRPLTKGPLLRNPLPSLGRPSVRSLAPPPASERANRLWLSVRPLARSPSPPRKF